MASGDEKPQQSTRRVIIAIDESEQAEQALLYYIRELHRPDNDVLLLHSAEPPFVTSHQGMVLSGESWDKMMEAEKNRVKKLEQKFAAKMTEHKVPGHIRAVFCARAGEAIVDVAKEEHAMIVVMGTRGMGTIRRTMLGSVSDYVVHHAHCPVLVVRH